MVITDLGRLMELQGRLRARRKRAYQDIDRAMENLVSEVSTTERESLPGTFYLEYMINASEQLGTLRSRIANTDGLLAMLSIREFRDWSWIRFGLSAQPDHRMSDTQIAGIILEHAPGLLLELIQGSK